MGVASARVETHEQIGPAISQALSHDGPFLIDLLIDPELPDPIVHPKGGQ
jgi:benzoylformate decarboxylase